MLNLLGQIGGHLYVVTLWRLLGLPHVNGVGGVISSQFYARDFVVVLLQVESR